MFCIQYSDSPMAGQGHWRMHCALCRMKALCWMFTISVMCGILVCVEMWWNDMKCVVRCSFFIIFCFCFSVHWVVLQKQPWHTYSNYRMKSSCSPCMCLALFHPDFHSIVAHGQDHLEVSKTVTRSEARFHFVFALVFIESCFRNNHGTPIVTIEWKVPVLLAIPWCAWRYFTLIFIL